jgi:hypothetical protein
MSSVYYEPPKEVFQDPKMFTCWAAALESWIGVTPNSPASWRITTQADAISQYSMFTDSKGGLEVKEGFKWLAAGCGMEFKVFKKAKDLTGAFLDEKLRRRRYLYFLFAGGDTGMGNNLGHACVIYEISKPWSQDCSISVMDPWPGNGIKPGQPLTAYTRANEAIVAWLEL